MHLIVGPEIVLEKETAVLQTTENEVWESIPMGKSKLKGVILG